MEYGNLFDYLIKIQSITKIGLLYSTDPYAINNYKEIQQLTLTMLEDLQDIEFTRNNYFERDVYPTPNLSVRTVVMNDAGDFIMVKEKKEGKYSLPGGWLDLYDSPSEGALREVQEETGAEVKITGIVALLNRTPYQTPTSVPAYVIVFKAEFVAFTGPHDHEISDVKWINRDNLPPLSNMLTSGEMDKILDATFSNKVIFD